MTCVALNKCYNTMLQCYIVNTMIICAVFKHTRAPKMCRNIRTNKNKYKRIFKICSLTTTKYYAKKKKKPGCTPITLLHETFRMIHSVTPIYNPFALETHQNAKTKIHNNIYCCASHEHCSYINYFYYALLYYTIRLISSPMNPILGVLII